MDDDPKPVTGADPAPIPSDEDRAAPPGKDTVTPASGPPPVSYGMNDLFPQLAFVWLALTLIQAAPRRVRRANEKQIKGVIRSIERYGFRIPILVRSVSDGSSYEVIDGHIRLEAARRLGAEVIPCIVIDDLAEVQIRRLRLSLNKLQETGDWDLNVLRLEIGEIIEISGEIEIPGFQTPEIEALRFGAEAAEAEDPADMVPDVDVSGADAVTRAGDIWKADDHRVLCGSARDGTATAALLAGQVADAVFTDPPYNVKINGHVRSARAGFAEFAEASGEMSRSDFVTFLVETLGNAAEVLRPGGVLFACIDWRHIGEMLEALKTLGLDLLNICVWVKPNAGMGSLYRSQYEMVFVARRPGAGHQNNVELGRHGRNRTNIWSYPGATGGQKDPDDNFHVHPTVKPIRLVMDALLDVSGPGDLVLDPFLGSGTTLLAAERTGRRCVGVEIDPRYVDLTICRWQEMTGRQAIHAETGESFDDRAARARALRTFDRPHSEEDF